MSELDPEAAGKTMHEVESIMEAWCEQGDPEWHFDGWVKRIFRRQSVVSVRVGCPDMARPNDLRIVIKLVNGEEIVLHEKLDGLRAFLQFLDPDR